MSSSEVAAPDPPEPIVDPTEVTPRPSTEREVARDRAGVLTHPRLRRVILYLVLALLGLFAVWWFRFRPFVSTDDARVAAPVVAVAAQQAGRVDRVLVKEGQQIQAGDALVELDASAERAQVERARSLVAVADARVGEAEAQLALETLISDAAERRARAGVSSAKAAHHKTVSGARAEDLAKARAEVAAAEAVTAQALRDLERARALAQQGAITPRELENAQTAESSARASLDARKAMLKLLEHGARPEDISISEAGVMQAEAGLTEAQAGSERVALRKKQVEGTRAQAAQARAELALSEVALSRMTLRSSLGGTVVRVGVDPGDSLSAGQAAVTVVDLTQAWIAANVEETAIGLVRPGQLVHVSIDEGGVLSGKIEVVAHAAASQFALIPAENAAGNFTKVVQRIPIRISIDDPARALALRVGQSVEVKIRVR